MDVDLKKWFEPDELPSDFYELLGMPRLCPRKEVLVPAIQEAFQFYHAYQHHPDSDRRDRARRLQLRAGEAGRVVRDAELWEEYDETIIAQLRQEYSEAADDDLESTRPEDLCRWLTMVHNVDPERAQKLAQTRLASSKDCRSDQEPHQIGLVFVEPEETSAPEPRVPTDRELKQLSEEILEGKPTDPSHDKSSIHFPPRLPTARAHPRRTGTGPKRARKLTRPTPPPRKNRRSAVPLPPRMVVEPASDKNARRTAHPVFWMIVAAVVTIVVLGTIGLAVAYFAGALDGFFQPLSTQTSVFQPWPLSPEELVCCRPALYEGVFCACQRLRQRPSLCCTSALAKDVRLNESRTRTVIRASLLLPYRTIRHGSSSRAASIRRSCCAEC